MRIDLHTHSTCSDGTASPRALVEQAHLAGLDVVALTDHDNTSGWDEAVATAGEVGIDLVRGIEISTKYAGRSVHLLAYLPDPTHPGLSRMLSTIVQGRDQRLPAMVANLRAHGIEITEDAVLAKARDADAVGRPHVADVLVDLDVVRSRDAAFAEWLNRDRPGYASRPAAALEDAIETVAAAGGVSVLAHPWGRGGEQVLGEDELPRLGEVGLTGLEVDHLDHDEGQRRRLRAVARTLDLVVTGSSDFHGAGKPEHLLGVETTDPEEYERLLDAASRASAASGRPTPTVTHTR